MVTRDLKIQVEWKILAENVSSMIFRKALKCFYKPEVMEGSKMKLQDISVAIFCQSCSARFFGHGWLLENYVALIVSLSG